MNLRMFGGAALKNLAGALPTDEIGYTLSAGWEVKMEIPVKLRRERI